MTQLKNTREPKLHYHCRHCGGLLARDGERWVDVVHHTSCEQAHLPNGQFHHGTSNSTCRHCGAAIVWIENRWRTESAPGQRTCTLEHTV